jgi:hypothetical protein
LALQVFRRLADHVARMAGDGGEILESATHSSIAAASPQVQQQILDIITGPPVAKIALGSLLRFDALPAREAWITALGTSIGPIDRHALEIAVARTLDHQSQEATDCRWCEVLVHLAAGRLHFPTVELVREITEYPNYRDLRQVRPSIRATELTLREVPTQWPSQFWTECLQTKECVFPPEKFEPTVVSEIGTTSHRAKDVYGKLVAHSRECLSSTAVDARYDSVFGTALYCLGIVQELLVPGSGNSIVARMALRTVLECYITLAYLVSRDDAKLWQSYRVYGAGQAKLSYLKLLETDDLPGYISPEALEALANEDQWQEFLKIDLGHWDRSNLRQLSESAGVKADYDRFYSWPSTYTHGHWGAVRDSVLTVCFNPLHRLHRIARPTARVLNDVLPDVCGIFDKILELVDRAYPSFPERISVGSAARS